MNNAVKIIIATVLLAAAAFFVFRFVNQPTPGDSVLEAETVWKCSNESCGNIFRVKKKDLLVVQRESGSAIPKCPKCSKLATEVYECQFCKGVFAPIGHGAWPDNCPLCGKDLAGDSSKDLAKPKPQETPGHQ